MKRVVAAVVAVLLAGSLAGINSVASASSGVRAAPSFTPTIGTWKTCSSSGIQCSTLTVPLNYAQPDNGQTVKLAITRLLADPAAGTYLGIMVGNPGGPGGSGTFIPVLRDYVPGTAAKRYDWVGFDPRGVGESTPALHCNPNYFGGNRPNFEPRTNALLRYWLTKSNSYAAACAKSSAKNLLPYMTTRDSVRDMESLRVAMHDALPQLSPKRAALEKLNFYGFSYGTYLGVGYASLYPTKVGRFVLDGVVDPARFWYASNFDQSIAFDKNINIFFAWMAKNNKVFKLGTKPKKIRAGFNALLKKLDKKPSGPAGKLGPDELTDALLSAGYYVYDWASIGAAYSKLVRTGKGADLYAMYASGNQGADADNGYAVYLGVQCTDVRRPPLPQQLRETRKVHKRAPFLAWDNTWYNMPCLNWAAPSRGKIPVATSVLNNLGTKILLISETKDAATPFAGALNVRRLYKGASLIAGVGGTTHASSLSGVSCVDKKIELYLSAGVVPKRQPGSKADALCPRVPPPPAAGGSRVLARPSGTSALHQLLLAEQLPFLR